jgi:hypothetical protein
VYKEMDTCVVGACVATIHADTHVWWVWGTCVVGACRCMCLERDGWIDLREEGTWMGAWIGGWMDTRRVTAVCLQAVNLQAVHLQAVNLQAVHLQAVNLQAVHLQAVNSQAVRLQAVRLDNGWRTYKWMPVVQVAWGTEHAAAAAAAAASPRVV